ncbi:DUF429 domain-containing protein [Exiguobacterium sp. H66]|uniref:DUF429 domain-containing protein n=1 Tax=Exiguobacterium sp. H66 TaxID=2751208 RepID=UPI001BE5C161|nr:DUF429 domain-containing protein [Exiguobacterium sp. H66]
MRVTGIDAAKAGWVAVSIEEGQFSYQIVEHLDQLENSDVLYIDMPIGLETDTRRTVDQLLRNELKPGRTSSVFNAPLVSALDACDYATANAQSKQAAGLGLSKQAWYLLPKIQEARSNYRDGMYESHPEVCFARLTGHPARHNKKTVQGIKERTELLRQFACPTFWEQSVKGVATDDWIDACLLAVAATCPVEYLPNHRPVDATGHPLYAAAPKKSPSPEWCG